MNHGEIVSFIWGVADLIRDTFKRGKYQDVILPLTVLRRLDCVLAPTKPKVLETHRKLKGRLENLEPQLRKASGFAFYNTSRFDFERLLQDAPNVAANLRHSINGFSPNMREVLEKFDFLNTITKLEEAGLLFKVLERFKNVDLHPDRLPNPVMGTIFEELIRKFNEALNENPGEHFTPRDVVHLMVGFLLVGDEGRLREPHRVITVCDPCCGTGGMLTIAKDHILALNPAARVHLFGQEVNPETFAVCKSDLFMKAADGRDAENILFGSTLSQDRHARRPFDYLIANPPYGKDWKRDQEAVEAEHERGDRGRFIDATAAWAPMRRNLGDKRREIPPDRRAEIVALYRAYQESERSKIFPTTRFGYRKITVERPLRLNFQAVPERIARLDAQAGFANLTRSARRGAARAADEARGRELQDRIRKMLASLPDTLWKDREAFLAALEGAAEAADLRVTATVRKAIIAALGERDETAEICRDAGGHPEPDPDLRDFENVPLGEAVEAYFDREVRPYVGDAWINTAVRDPRDSQLGRVGYEINFNRYFYRYQPPRPLEEIEADIRAVEKEILSLLREVAGPEES